jgi:antibiotic biosynthesis monooxygenase (ABM) superfamily enzyme
MTTKIKIITAFKIWLVIYPSITAFLYFFGDVMSILSLYQRTLILTIILVPWIIFIGVPLINQVAGLIAGKLENR